MDETNLIAAARAGDEDAFKELYGQHHKYVRAIGRSILRTDDLDDLCQETFLLAFTRLESFAGNSQFRTWLSRIALNRCLVVLRGQRRTAVGATQRTPEEDDLRLHTRACIDRTLEGLPERLDLERLLRTLTPAQREALELAYVEDLPASEIAAALNTTVTAIKGRIATAKKKIKMTRRR